MTSRTASLLMLFVAALIATGVLLAVTVRVLEGSSASGPWLAPFIAVTCQATTLYLGRRFILPYRMAVSAARSAVTIVAMVASTMAIAAGVGWVVERTIGWVIASPVFTLALWFVLLWGAVSRQRNWNPRLKNGVRKTAL